MSTLQVSNIHFESTGNNRLEYSGSNSYNLVGGGVTVATVNTTAVSFPTGLSVNNFIANTSISIGAVLVANSTVVNATHLAGIVGASYQLNSTLAANVATLTANNASFVGTVSAANVVSNAQLSGNLANYTTTTALTNNLANYTTTTALTNNLANYQTTAGLSSNVALLTANNTTYVNGKTEGNLNVNSATTALTANNSTYLGGAISSSYVNINIPVRLATGYTVTAYNLGTGSGTVTPDPWFGNYQYITNNGAFTLAAPGSNDCAIDLLIINGASAGSITAGSGQGWTIGTSLGGTFTTTNGHRFIVSIRKINGISTYSIYAMQ